MRRNKTFLQKFIHEKGRHFYAALLPEDIERGRPGDCFDHCMMQAMRSDGKYRYCEGVACIEGKWIHHAWLTDKQGLVAFDPTWRALTDDGDDLPLHVVHYLGATLNLNTVAEFVIETGYKSPLANYKKNPELAQKVYDHAL